MAGEEDGLDGEQGERKGFAFLPLLGDQVPLILPGSATTPLGCTQWCINVLPTSDP